MAEFLLDFEWFRCPDGYRVVRASDIVGGQIPNPDDLWIAPNSDNRVFYRPLEKYDLLYVAFANLRAPDEVVRFVNLYGPLLATTPKWGDSISGVLKSAQFFRDLLRCKALGPKKLMSFYVAHESASWRELGLTPPEDDVQKLDRLMGTVCLVPNPKRGVGLRVTVEVLMAGLWWQLAQKLSGDTRVRECRYCGALFAAGPNTQRRADATFCSSEHSIRFHSLKRSKAG